MPLTKATSLQKATVSNITIVPHMLKAVVCFPLSHTHKLPTQNLVLTSSVEGMPLMKATSLPLPFTRTPTCQSGL
jgi:hypothetical protein